MAKTRHNRLLDTVDELITNAKNKGIVHLHSQDEQLTGRTLTINGQTLCHFGTCGYLGLEQDIRLKKATAEAVMKYGTQFPMSKAYVSSPLYSCLESLMSEMYSGYPVILTKNSTIGHIAVIPSIVNENDLVILDQQVHASVQSAVQLLKPKGIAVEIVRHSRLDHLEKRLAEVGNKYDKIWYMADGVYSMYGDFAPIREMIALADKYAKLHLYVDDAHGMSWAGLHGSGYIMSQVKMHPKMVYCGTMGKSFGVSGGVIVFPSTEMHRKVEIFGGPLTFSVQMEPPMLAACIASAKIHLSPEIQELQRELAEKISYCNYLISQTSLPLVEVNQSPIFFIGTGMPATGYSFVRHLMDEGYYVNLGVFPAVPAKNTGVRFTISRHNRLEDIKGLVDAMVYHYPLTLAGENRTQNEVRRAFRLPLINESTGMPLSKKESLIVVYQTDICALDESEWNLLISPKISVDFQGLKFLQNAFSGNPLPEENWNFHYLIIRDTKNNPILATFFISGICKDDIFSQEAISVNVEKERVVNPYYLTSRSLIMGTLATEGEHFYLDQDHPQWKQAVRLFAEQIAAIQEKENATAVYLRDFYDNQQALKEVLQDMGFVKVDIPESCSIEKMEWSNTQEYISQLSRNSRQNIRKEVLAFEECFDAEVQESPAAEEMERYIDMFRSVKSKNYAVNLFDYPDKFFKEMAGNNQWEMIVLRLKPHLHETNNPVAVTFNYKNPAGGYTGLLIGMDYAYLKKYGIYRQSIYRILLRAKALGYSKVRLGISATVEKKKFGASISPMIAFVQTKDNFNIELIEQMGVTNG